MKKIHVPARDNQLQIDIDSNTALAFFRKQWVIFNSRMSAYGKLQTSMLAIEPSPSGKPGRWHITITFPFARLTDTDRIALQACLGSDRTRELLSMCRCLNGSPIPTLFFERRTK